jgi:DNA repair protein RadA/Sms
MAKVKVVFACQACGAQFPKWQGQCTDCGVWNSLVEETQSAISPSSSARLTPFDGYASGHDTKIRRLSELNNPEKQLKFSSGLPEFDRVLGDGIVRGSMVLLGGDPGIGKSTLLLQSLCYLSQTHKTLYISGEESLEQISARAERLQLHAPSLQLLADTNVERILQQLDQERPEVVVIDSIQTMYTENVTSAPGGVAQVRESAAQLVRFAKQTGIAIFLVGHVTKEGNLAGPRVLEHMVDTVLYFEGEQSSRFRLIRAVKNRFGTVNELGVFAMTEAGLKEVTNPSAIFLSREGIAAPGSVVMVMWEGTRPLLVEVQALVDTSHLDNPRRVAVGLDYNRLSMLLAVLHRHGGIATHDQDVFVNIVGGLRISETALDLAILLAVVSSLRNKILPADLAVFGEVGLGGEIRPVANGQERLKDASKHGFKQIMMPAGNTAKKSPEGVVIHAIKNLQQCLTLIREL